MGAPAPLDMGVGDFCGGTSVSNVSKSTETYENNVTLYNKDTTNWFRWTFYARSILRSVERLSNLFTKGIEEMTCEVAVMNRRGIALAADSAVTLGNGNKIYHSAEKLFPISLCAPVGIMTYGSQTLWRPWELIIKIYGQKLDGRSLTRSNNMLKTSFISSSELKQYFHHRLSVQSSASCKKRVARFISNPIDE